MAQSLHNARAQSVALPFFDKNSLLSRALIQYLPVIVVFFIISCLALLGTVIHKNRIDGINHVNEETALLAQGILNASMHPEIRRMKDPQLALKQAVEKVLPASRNFGATHIVLTENDVIKAEIGNLLEFKNNNNLPQQLALMPFHSHGFVQQGDVTAMIVENKSLSIVKIAFKDEDKKIFVIKSLEDYKYFNWKNKYYYVIAFNLIFLLLIYNLYNIKPTPQIYSFVPSQDKEIVLSNADKTLHRAMDLVQSGIIIWDENDNLVMANSSFRELHQFKPQDLRIGMKRQEALMKVSKFRQSLTTPLNDAMSQSDEMRLEDGRWFQINSSRTQENGLVSIITDISPLKKHEQEMQISQSELQHQVYELQKARDYLTIQKAEIADKNEQLALERESAVQANLAKSNFLANMSHDLRTPLNAILGFSETMKEEVWGKIGNARYAEYPADIFKAGTQLLSLVDDILDVTRIERGKMELRFEEITLENVLEDTLPVIFKLIERRKHSLILDVDSDISLVADKRAMRLMLQNLLTNAVKFTPDGGEIRLIAKMQAGGLNIIVKDNGIGIKEGNLAKLCNQFEMGEDAYQRNFQGSGLGLFITKSLIEMHKGTIKITSLLGEGTKVQLFIPA